MISCSTSSNNCLIAANDNDNDDSNNDRDDSHNDIDKSLSFTAVLIIIIPIFVVIVIVIIIITSRYIYLIVPFWYASAAYQASLVEPWLVFWRDAVEPKYPWRDQTSLICRRSVPKSTIRYLPYPNSAQNLALR